MCAGNHRTETKGERKKMDRLLHHRKSEYLFPTAFESASHSLPWGRAQNLPSSCAFRKTIERSPITENTCPTSSPVWAHQVPIGPKSPAGIRGSWASTPVIWSMLTSIQSHLDNRSEIRRNGMAEIRLHEGESIENALRRFKRKVMQEDIIKEVRKHSFYLKPGEKKRIKQALARKRSRKKVRREPQEDRK